MKPTALRNTGANCYLNSGIQALSSCPRFKKDMQILSSENDKCEKLVVFNVLMNTMNDGGSIMELSQNFIFSEWNKSGQQDSYELLAHVINQVYDEVRSYKENNVMKKGDVAAWLKKKLPLRMNMDYDIKCKCGNVDKSPLQSDIALHLSFHNPDTEEFQGKKEYRLNEMMHNHFQEEDIQDFECGAKNCFTKSANRQLRLLWPPPNTICLHLQRLYWNGYRMKKIDNNVLFRNRITLKENYFKSSDNSVHDEVHYYLKSVIVHYGMESCGHYTCYKQLNNRWYYTSDTTIREVDPIEVLKCNPYILFYEQCDVREVIPMVINVDERINLFIHAISACLTFVNELYDARKLYDNASLERLLYLIDLGNGHILKNERPENVVIDEICKDKVVGLTTYKFFRDLSNQVLGDCIELRHGLPMIFILHRKENCNCDITSRFFNGAYIVAIEKYKEDKLNLNTILSTFCGTYQIATSNMSETICIILGKCVNNGSQKWPFKKGIITDDKIVIDSVTVSSSDSKSKEYYRKSFATDNLCIRYSNECWFRVDKYNVRACKVKDYKDEDMRIMFYNTTESSSRNDDAHDGSYFSYSNFLYSRSSNTQTTITTAFSPVIIDINVCLNSFIQAMSSCTNFIYELNKISSESKINLKRFMYLINFSNGMESKNSELDRHIARMWSKDDVYQLMGMILNSIFDDIFGTIGYLTSMVNKSIKCSCGRITELKGLTCSVDVSSKGTTSNLQMLIDELFQNGELVKDWRCNENCQSKSSVIESRLDKLLTRLICVRIIPAGNDKLKFGDTLSIKKEYWMNSKGSGHETFHLRSVINIDGSCYRLCYEKWYKITKGLSCEVNKSILIDCKPILLFYETLEVPMSGDKYLFCFAKCMSSCSLFLEWLNRIKDIKGLAKSKLLYNHLLWPDSINKGISMWNDSQYEEIFQIVNSIFNELDREIKVSEDGCTCLPTNIHLKYIHKCLFGTFKHSYEDTNVLDIDCKRSNKDSLTIQELLDEYFNDRNVEGCLNERKDCYTGSSVSINPPLPNTLCIRIRKENRTSIKSNVKVKLSKTNIFIPGQSQGKYILKSVIQRDEDESNVTFAYECTGKWIQVLHNDSVPSSLEEVLLMEPYIIFYELEGATTMDYKPLQSEYARQNLARLTLDNIYFNVKLFNFIQTISVCSKFLESIRGSIKSCADSTIWSSFFHLMDQINGNNEGSQIVCDTTWEDWCMCDYKIDIDPFLTILKDLSKCIKSSNELESTNPPLVIFTDGKEDKIIMKTSEAMILMISIRIIPDKEMPSFQELLDHNFIIYSDKAQCKELHQRTGEKSMNKLIEAFVSKTIGFFFPYKRSRVSMEIILRNQFCSNIRKGCTSGNAKEYCDSINCCCKYRLKSMIDNCGICYKLFTDQLYKVNRDGTMDKFEGDLDNIDAKLIFYE